MAGMAEVATGVLHNVGNVLNSVNIAASLTLEKLRSSKVEGLRKATALLAEHEHDLGAWLTGDPQGQRLPGYLRKLAGILTEENATAVAELEGLGKNVEHIKEIVAMQQSYARVTGVLEDLPLERLVEDALQLNATSFHRHGIEIVRDFRPAPPVRVDKHKVLQILINLLRNAKHAVEDSGRRDPRIAVTIDADGGLSRISIADNGVGIPAENLTNVFRHGFTTKKHGHGFGLHSGANAAKEMGGSISADSAGPGHGATFTLELPAAVAATN
jgi:C4-dicarboxylate-specific signal transduction histidine kinase